MIREDQGLIIKLSSTCLLLLMAQEKINHFMTQNMSLINEIKEDEEALEFMNLYYEECEGELLETASESLTTSNEAELSIENWREYQDGF